MQEYNFLSIMSYNLVNVLIFVTIKNRDYHLLLASQIGVTITNSSLPGRLWWYLNAMACKETEYCSKFEMQMFP